MKLSKKTLMQYKKEIVQILKANSSAILSSIKMLAPKDTGLMASGLKLDIGETSDGFYIKVIGSEGNTPRTKNGVTYKAREYFFPNDNERYMGPRSLKRAGQTDKSGKVIQPFIRKPLEDGIERAIDTLIAKYGIRLEIGWDA